VWADTPSNRSLRVVAFVEYKATSKEKRFSPGTPGRGVLRNFFRVFIFGRKIQKGIKRETKEKMFLSREEEESKS
jgi:hypothetical protein